MTLKKIIVTLALLWGAGTCAVLADSIILKPGKQEVKVYAERSTAAEVIATLKVGQQEVLIGESDKFFQVQRADGKVGYVLKTEAERIATEVESPADDAQLIDLPLAAEEPELSGADADEASAAPESAELAETAEKATYPCAKKQITVAKKTYDVADVYDVRTVYKKSGVNRANTFFVISKQEYRLYVYETVGRDTVLVAHYPVCYAKRTGNKTKSGDMSTPECSMKGAFSISQIANASTWKHDFKDGRGSMKAYGDWFMRLDLTKSTLLNDAVRSNRSIGIHGSSGNRESVPGNDSEGCIRLRDEDINHLKANYAQVGTKVVVKPYDKGKYGFEKRAQKALGAAYFHAQKGYRTVPEPKK